jgi:secreted Zn-dependent insulinase-like peptidase
LTKQVFYCSLAHLFAGLTYTLKPTKTGFELTAKGYNEKMPKFLLTIVDAIYALDLSEGWTKSYIFTVWYKSFLKYYLQASIINILTLAVFG